MHDTHLSEPRLPDETPFNDGVADGEVLGNYEIVRALGRGGMGNVYLARHRTLGRQVALKVLRTSYARDEELVRRFFQEAKAVNAICHEHIVDVHDFVAERRPEGPPRVY